jgi:hypothetical protein
MFGLDACIFLQFYNWCSIKDDYRTLVGLEDVDLLDTYTDTDEEEDNE